MRYFFIIYVLLGVLVVSIGGFRGELFKDTPFRLFPDMDDQDRIDPQSSSDFFYDGLGSREPVAKTVPQGYAVKAEAGEQESLSFTNDTSYYHTGRFDGEVFGNGLPVAELGLTEENLDSFIKRGAVAYNVHCSRCHGESGNGAGVVAGYGVPGVANLVTTKLPDGGIYDVIVNGRGGMMPFGSYVGVEERWEIIAYLRSLQYSRKVPLEQVKDAFEKGSKAQ